MFQALRPLAKEMLERAGVVVQFGSFIYCFGTYVMDVTTCVGPSMLPSFNAEGNIIFVEHISPRLGRLKAGDVVTAQSPRNPNAVICKRILGLEGDRIRVPPTMPRDSIRLVTVPKGHVWLQGDNQFVSRDSREYGPVPAALVKGKVVFKIWPPSQFGHVESRIP
ncbi:Peptidase S24/S26A/S26B/S26C family protein [Klebsormidium nitens]|uniref:Peptidase S24/S26A/S26B/S26C family protein n=1 Tax=Klebsormidium nitens TaxID=105231 RepID=A0A1Y1I0M7_KLENI|nr:Peptidase S24/S26A/S26B/S26C family protein [Klebsormidium nitens]|eukprot:GAQ84474.1 Peptidase S24/S26A/S26B/S26C family protein [Klebsormidium nitens]